MGKIGKGTRVWDPSGLWGDHVIGEGCTIGRFVEIGDGVRIGDRCKVEAFAFIPPGVVTEDDRGPWGPTFASPMTRGRGRRVSGRRWGRWSGRGPVSGRMAIRGPSLITTTSLNTECIHNTCPPCVSESYKESGLS